MEPEIKTNDLVDTDEIEHNEHENVGNFALNNDPVDESSENEISSDDEYSHHEIEPSRIDLNALWVVRRLRAKGHEAYLTGGCVRDLLLNKKPKDFDVATSAKPEEVRAIFRNSRLIGRRFLLAHVIFPGGKIIETATFRANPSEEIEEENGEDLLVVQDNVYGTIKEDAFRRDLTVNGLFYDPVEGKVIDYVDGRADLEARLIRTIGDPEIRLQEDPVRILRAIRFAKALDFSIEEKTLMAMRNHAKDLVRCAPARLQEEIIRLLNGGHAKECMALAFEIGALGALLPELIEGLSEGHPEEKSITESEIFLEWQKTLMALDKVNERGCQVSSAVAFSTVLMPAYHLLEKSEKNERNWIDRLCVSWAERIRLTRRDQDLIRILLSAMPLFSFDKIHRESARYLVRKPWFKEGLLAYIIYLTYQDASLEPIKLWKKLALEAKKPFVQDRAGTKIPAIGFRKRRPFQGGRRNYRTPRSSQSA